MVAANGECPCIYPPLLNLARAHTPLKEKLDKVNLIFWKIAKGKHTHALNDDIAYLLSIIKLQMPWNNFLLRDRFDVQEYPLNIWTHCRQSSYIYKVHIHSHMNSSQATFLFNCSADVLVILLNTIAYPRHLYFISLNRHMLTKFLSPHPFKHNCVV